MAEINGSPRRIQDNDTIAHGQVYGDPVTGVVRVGDGDTEWANLTSAVATSSAWNGNHLRLGAYRLWVDATGDLRIKNGAPTTDLDGAIVGTQL